MIAQLISIIQEHLIPLGGFGVFVAALLEEVIAPIPSPLVQMAAGFFLLPAKLSPQFFIDLLLVAVLPAALGVTIGSLFVYFIAYYAGKPAIDRWGGWLGLSWDDIERSRAKFRNARTDAALLFFLRVAPVVPSVAISAVCGLIRMGLLRYMIWTFLGTIIRATFLALIGWQAGALYREYADIIDRFELAVWVVLALGIAAFVIYRMWRKYAYK